MSEKSDSPRMIEGPQAFDPVPSWHRVQANLDHEVRLEAVGKFCELLKVIQPVPPT